MPSQTRGTNSSRQSAVLRREITFARHKKKRRPTLFNTLSSEMSCHYLIFLFNLSHLWRSMFLFRTCSSLSCADQAPGENHEFRKCYTSFPTGLLISIYQSNGVFSILFSIVAHQGAEESRGSVLILYVLGKNVSTRNHYTYTEIILLSRLF